MKENKDALKALQEFVSPDPLQSQKHTSVNLFISFSLEIECHLKTLFIQVHSGDVFLYLDAKYSNTTSVQSEVAQPLLELAVKLGIYSSDYASFTDMKNASQVIPTKFQRKAQKGGQYVIASYSLQASLKRLVHEALRVKSKL